VTLDGTRIDELASDARARFRARQIGFIFQQFHLVPYLSVRDNILAATLASPVPESEVRADQLVDSVGLAARRDHLPGELSAGEQQRVAIARAVLARPRLLLADEPTGNLDDVNASHVAQHLRAYADEGNMVLLATHDAETASQADRTIELRDGVAVE
jgi:ABC-type lipoprotein export system ATPase subunit